MLRKISSSPVRVGFNPTFCNCNPPGPAAMRPATMKNAAEEKSPGTVSCWFSSRSGGSSVVAEALAHDRHPAAPEHPLAVVAADRRCDARWCCRRHRGRPAGWQTSPARSPPASGSRCRASAEPPSISIGGVPLWVRTFAPISRKRPRYALHGTPHQRLIADQPRSEGSVPPGGP